MVMKSPLRNVILLLMVLLFGFNQPAEAQTPDAGELLRDVQARYASLQSYSATSEVLSGVTRDRSASIFPSNQSQEMRSTFTIKLARPQMYKTIWEQGNSFFSSKGAVWSDGESRYATMGGQISAKNLLLWKWPNPCGFGFPVRPEHDSILQGSVLKFNFVNIGSCRPDTFEADRLNGSKPGNRCLQLLQLLTSYCCEVRTHPVVVRLARS